MSVPIQNYVWIQGSDLEISLVYKEGPVDAEVPINLTGWSLRMDVVDESGRLFTFNSEDIGESGVDVVGPGDNEVVLGSEGQIEISVPRSMTLGTAPVAARMALGNTVFNYDIFLRKPDGKQHPILKGTITMEESYTLWA